MHAFTHAHTHIRGHTHRSIEALASSCPGLEELNVSHCELLTDLSLLQLQVAQREAPTLRYLNASRCKQLSEDAFSTLLEHCPRLVSIGSNVLCYNNPDHDHDD